MNAQEKNTYLNGNFAPIQEEQDYPCTEIEGEIPADLEGCFLRNGPNPMFEPLSEPLYHWFDGDGMIHCIEFAGGHANYRNRWIKTKGLNIESEEGKSIWKGYNSLHELEFHHGMMIKNVANTAFVWHQNRLLALWEAGTPHEISLPDLKTKGEETFKGEWLDPFTAHPAVDPKTGEMITFGYNSIEQPYFKYGVIDKNGKIVHKAGIELKGKPTMMHDCAITENYTLIIDMPLTFDLQRIINGGASFAWEPDNGARIGLLPRYGNNDDVKWFDVTLGFIFHVLNAWEEGEEVILEACKSKYTSVLDGDGDDRKDENGQVFQYRFNLATGECVEKRVDETYVEFSRINEAYVGRKNRYAYASRFSQDPSAPRFDAVVKFDRENDSKQVFEFPDNCYSGEFVFAAKTNSQAEDDGYYIGFMQDETERKSFCLVFDAKDLTKGPVAKITMGSRVPYGFHALWVSASDIAKQKSAL